MHTYLIAESMHGSDAKYSVTHNIPFDVFYRLLSLPYGFDGTYIIILLSGRIKLNQVKCAFITS